MNTAGLRARYGNLRTTVEVTKREMIEILDQLYPMGTEIHWNNSMGTVSRGSVISTHSAWELLALRATTGKQAVVRVDKILEEKRHKLI